MAKPQIPVPIHKWTALKLEYLDYYLQAYVIATKQSREKYYIDAFAGCGECIIYETGCQIEGSPWRALNAVPGFTQYYLVEMDGDLASHLRKKIIDKDIKNAHVYTGDCNEVIPHIILPRIPKNVPSFAFLDPPGLQINWKTIQSLATHREHTKMELLILYPYDMAIARLFNIALENQACYDTLTRLYGDEKWRDEFKDSLRLEETPTQQRERFLRLYINNLLDLGYKYAESYGPLYSYGHKPLYHVIFTSDKDVGIKIMRDVWSKTRFVAGEMGYKPIKRPSIHP